MKEDIKIKKEGNRLKVKLAAILLPCSSVVVNDLMRVFEQIQIPESQN